MEKNILSNTFAQVWSKAGTAIISIFLISILTNYLSVEWYGLYSKIYNYVWIFVFLADLGLYTITIREISENKQNTQKIVWNMLTLRVLLWILMLFVWVSIAYFIPGYNSSVALWGIVITSFFTIFQLINSSILALMQSYLKMQFSFVSSIVGKLINVWFVCLIVYWLYSQHTGDDVSEAFLWIMFAGVLGVMANTMLNYLYARKIQAIKFCFDRDYIIQIFKTSLPYGIALFLWVIYFKVDIILLSIIEWPELWDKSIALYSLPMKIVEVVMMLGGFYLNSMLPSFTENIKNKKMNLFHKSIQKSLEFLLSISCLILVLGVLFREQLIEIIANKDYLITDHAYNSADAFLVVFGMIVFHFLSLVFIYALIASKKQSKLLKINIFITLFNIIGNIILIPYMSFIGAGIITFISQVLLMILWYIYTRDLIKIDIKSLGYVCIKNLFLIIMIYLVGLACLKYISVNIYFDTLIYGGILFGIYANIIYQDIKKTMSR